ncbi:MAG: hypothetical protein AB1896_20475, partial [Thermodesulfobacteriota bacterium]
QARIADGQTIAVGDFLASNGDGALKKYAPITTDAGSPYATFYTSVVVAVALEACDMSGLPEADPSGKCLVQVI